MGTTMCWSCPLCVELWTLTEQLVAVVNAALFRACLHGWNAGPLVNEPVASTDSRTCTVPVQLPLQSATS